MRVLFHFHVLFAFCHNQGTIKAKIGLHCKGTKLTSPGSADTGMLKSSFGLSPGDLSPLRESEIYNSGHNASPRYPIQTKPRPLVLRPRPLPPLPVFPPRNNLTPPLPGPLLGFGLLGC